MKRIRNTVIAIGLIIATMGLTSCSVLEKTDKAKGKQIVAKVGDTVIKRSQIDEALKDYEATLIENYGEDYLEDDTAKSYYESARQSKLDELVYNELVQMYIKDNNIEVNDEDKEKYVEEQMEYYKSALGATDDDFEEKAKAQFNLTLDEMKDVLGEMYYSKLAGEHLLEVSSNESAMEKYKEDNKEDYDAMEKQKAVLYIVNTDKEKIEAAKKELDEGRSIDEIAATYSTDSGASNGGFFGFMDTDSDEMSSIDANFVEAVKNLNVGEKSDIVESTKDDDGNLKFGYFLIQIIDRETGLKYQLRQDVLTNGVEAKLKKIYKDELETDKYKDNLNN